MFNTNNNKTIANYNLKSIKSLDYLTLSLPLDDTSINNLKFLKNKITINLSYRFDITADEKAYYNEVIKILNSLANNKQRYSILIYVNSRKLLKDSNLLKMIPKNVDLGINTEDYNYSLAEYLEEDKLLDTLIYDIKKANLSPLEKYLATYDIVKNYKPYKNNDENSKDGTSLKETLDKNNKYIVCAGFAKLLNELLARLDIPSKYISLSVDTRKNEDELLKLNKHARNLIRLKDTKYNINGYYVADSTWDNSSKGNYYLNALLTFDRKKEAKQLESLEDEDLLLDFHNQKEFNEKINYFIKKRISHPKITPDIEEELRKKTYQNLCLKILDILKSLDHDKYLSFLTRYKKILTLDLSKTTSHEMEPVISNFLNDYSSYIIPLSNNKINNLKIIDAIVNIRTNLYHENNTQVKNYLNNLMEDNEKRSEKTFPYVYNPNNNSPAYLEEKPKTK